MEAIMKKYFNVSLVCVIVFALGCEKVTNSEVEGFRKEVNDFCYAHSIQYWEETGKIDALNSAGLAEKQMLFKTEFSSKIVSKKMNGVVYEQTKELTLQDYYPYLQKHIPLLTKEPFDCEAIEEFYGVLPTDKLTTNQEGSPKFDSVSEVFEYLHDFVSGDGTFKLLSSDPPHIQLAPRVVPRDISESIDKQLDHALAYGVYRSFVHSPVDNIKVTVVPLELDLNTGKSRYLTDKRKTLSISREEAFGLLKRYLDITSFTDLIRQEADTADRWSDEFEKLIYRENDSGEQFGQDLSRFREE